MSKAPIDFPNSKVTGSRGSMLEIDVPLTKDGKKRKTVMIPRSQIHEDSEVYDEHKHNEGKLVIPEWLAKDRGLL